jgi:hypothetical protein
MQSCKTMHQAPQGQGCPCPTQATRDAFLSIVEQAYGAPTVWHTGPRGLQSRRRPYQALDTRAPSLEGRLASGGIDAASVLRGAGGGHNGQGLSPYARERCADAASVTLPCGARPRADVSDADRAVYALVCRLRQPLALAEGPACPRWASPLSCSLLAHGKAPRHRDTERRRGQRGPHPLRLTLSTDRKLRWHERMATRSLIRTSTELPEDDGAPRGPSGPHPHPRPMSWVGSSCSASSTRQST